MDIAAEVARLREAAEERPLRLPVNRRVDERHHAVTDDGLGVWFTLQLTGRHRIWEALFERDGAPPADGEIQVWLRELLPGREAGEAAGLPGGATRRFELFEPL